MEHMTSTPVKRVSSPTRVAVYPLHDTKRGLRPNKQCWVGLCVRRALIPLPVSEREYNRVNNWGRGIVTKNGGPYCIFAIRTAQVQCCTELF